MLGSAPPAAQVLASRRQLCGIEGGSRNRPGPCACAGVGAPSCPRAGVAPPAARQGAAKYGGLHLIMGGPLWAGSMHPLFSTCRRRNRLQPYCCSSVAAALLLQRRGTGHSRQQPAALAMDASDPVLTASDSWPGTPAYSAPSQCLAHSTKFPSCAPQSQSRPLHRRLCSNCKCARASWLSGHRESTADRVVM